MVRNVDLIAAAPRGAAPQQATVQSATDHAQLLPWLLGIGIALCATLIYHYSIPGDTAFDHYRRLAEAFLQGRVDLTNPPRHLEISQFAGRHYVIPPPLPALLMAPYVAVAGARASQALFGAVAGGLSAMLALFIAARMTDRTADRIWLAVLFAFGTIIWHLTAVGSVWYVAHVVGALGITLAVLETVGQKRPFVIGAGVAAAFWSHLPTALTLPFFIIMTSDRWAPDGLRQWRTVRLGYLNALAAPIAAAILLNFGYNWLRFETIADLSYRLRVNVQNEWWFDRGLFHVAYIPRHLEKLLYAAPIIQSTFPYVTYSVTGLAIWATTPAFLFALLAPLRAKGTWAAWAGILPTAIVVMSHGATGMTQFGYRLAVDFYPLLFYLTITGMRPPLRGAHKAVIALSVLANLWGVLWERMAWRVL